MKDSQNESRAEWNPSLVGRWVRLGRPVKSIIRGRWLVDDDDDDGFASLMLRGE